MTDQRLRQAAERVIRVSDTQGLDALCEAIRDLRETLRYEARPQLSQPYILYHMPDETRGMSQCLPECPACAFFEKQKT